MRLTLSPLALALAALMLGACTPASQDAPADAAGTDAAPTADAAPAADAAPEAAPPKADSDPMDAILAGANEQTNPVGVAYEIFGQTVFALELVGVLLITAALGAMVFWQRSILQHLSWLQEAWQCLAWHPLRWLSLTLLAWAAQGLAVYLICRAFGVSLGPLEATGFYALAMVAGALSALPAGLGGTEAVLTGLLVASGATASAALGITVLARLLTLWLAVLIG